MSDSYNPAGDPGMMEDSQISKLAAGARARESSPEGRAGIRAAQRVRDFGGRGTGGANYRCTRDGAGCGDVLGGPEDQDAHNQARHGSSGWGRLGEGQHRPFSLPSEMGPGNFPYGPASNTPVDEHGPAGTQRRYEQSEGSME
jgi:hypothetical protein